MLRRAQPWLGTRVEIVCHAPDEAQTLAASRAGFTAIARIHKAMSRHDPTSELSAINALLVGQWLALGADTACVLAFAHDLGTRSQGVFDVWSTSHFNSLPHGHPNPAGDWQSVVLNTTGTSLWKHHPARADLGGIAKGYAVDMAVQAMQQAGALAGWVNAGGDLRVFGDTSVALHVRLPTDTTQTRPHGTLCEGAAATSASYVDPFNQPPEHPPLRHGVTQQTTPHGRSCTVLAPTCMVADALTKLVAATGQTQHPLLAHYGAQAWID